MSDMNPEQLNELTRLYEKFRAEGEKEYDQMAERTAVERGVRVPPEQVEAMRGVYALGYVKGMMTAAMRAKP
jgi:hypothetical protein